MKSPIILISLSLGLLFDFFFYGKVPGVSVFLFVLITLAATYFLANGYKRRLSQSVIFVMILALFFSAMIFIRASIPLTILNIAASLYLLLLIADLMSKPESQLPSYTLHHYTNRILKLPFRVVRNFFKLGQSLLESRGQLVVKKHAVTPIVRGIVLTIPILLIFLLLLSSADLIFKQYVTTLFDIFNFRISPNLVSHLFLIGLVASALMGAYALIFLYSNQAKQSESQTGAKITIGTTESTIILGSVGSLFLFFLLIQLTYLFGGQSNITNAGFTYSQYARKGFFELIVVAVISLGLLLKLNKSTVRNTDQHKMRFTWLSSLLIVEVMAIMISASKRLSLYEQAYGFTELRLYSHIFIGWLAVVFIFLLIHIVRGQRENQFAYRTFLAAVVFLALLNFINPDAMITRQNIERFDKTGKIDLLYLGNLSADATPEISKLLTRSNEKVRRGAAHELYFQKAGYGENSNHWQSFNFARRRASQIFQKHARELEANIDYRDYLLDKSNETY